MTEKQHTVIQLFSGGLDSILSAKIMKDMGFRVIGVHFYTGFNDAIVREHARGALAEWEPEPCVVEAADSIGIELVSMDIGGEEYRKILLNPRYGYGSAANPCIDCRIYLLEKAREIMEREGAICIVTGEVLGQRPMSQHKNAMNAVEKRSGLSGRLLRPLSAKLFPPTIPEEEGIIDRERLYDIQGRTRARQQELAKELGIDFFPTPAGGCILTARQFNEKFKDLLAHATPEDVTLERLRSLLSGRHMRLPGGTKVIVGRNKEENEYLQGLLGERYWYFRARDFQGPLTFIMDERSEDEFPLVAAITARYGKGSKESGVVVFARKGDEERMYEVRPVEPEETERYLISPF